MRVLEFLFSLHHVPPHRHMTWHVGLADGPPWLAALLILLVIGLAAWSYRRQTVTRAQRIVLIVLRATVLALVVLLFFQPRLVVSHAVKTRSVVAVWVDGSLSMSLRDPYRRPAMQKYIRQVRWRTGSAGKGSRTADAARRPTRFDVACNLLNAARKTWLGQLAKTQDIALFTGGVHAKMLGLAHGAKQLPALLQTLRSQKPGSMSTNVGGVLQGIMGQLQGRPISAVVLLTDGRSTVGQGLRAATAAARRNAIALYPIPVGQVTAPFNIALRHVQAPQNAFAKDPITVRADIAAAGVRGPTPVSVQAYVDRHGKTGRMLASQRVLLTPHHANVPVRMMFRKKTPGRLRMLVRIKPVPGELTRRNNTVRGIDTTILKARIRLLYVDGYPRWEYRYLKNEYVREKTVLVSCLLLSADNGFAQEGSLPIRRFPDTQKELDRYDVVLIGDVDPNFFSAKQDRLLLKFVGDKGGGFGMIAGPLFTPNAYGNTPLAPLLPVIPDSQTNPVLPPAPDAPYRLQLTAAGWQSNLFKFFNSAKKNAWQVAHLPPMYWYKPVLGLKPSATVLAQHPTATVNGRPMPLLVIGHYGAGTTMYSGYCDTWRWRYYRGEPLYESYWTQMARLLYRQRAIGRSRRIYLTADQTHATLGQVVHFVLRVQDRRLRQAMPPRVLLRLTGRTGSSTLTLLPVGGHRHEYEGAMLANRLGNFTVKPVGAALPAAVTSMHLSVGLPNREFANPTVDMAALRRVADATSGKVVEPLQTAGLSKLLPDRSVEAIVASSQGLWDKPIALFVLVILLAAEWIIRKSASLI